MNIIKRLSLILVGLSCLLACREKVPTVNNYTNIPEWSKKAVWYQIFPERFRNGDKKNDPQLEDIKGSWPHDLNSPYKVSSWQGDWFSFQPWENKSKDFYFLVQRRRYGGDLQGVMDKLSYLQDLGINAIYFNPLFEAPSLHKYDAATYHHIDDNFGPDPKRDRELTATENPNDPATWKWTTADSLFLKLIEACHIKGIRIIIDGIFNHTGINFWAFQDVLKKQKNSQFAAWYTIHKWDNPDTPENEFTYEGWAGVKELPEIREEGNGLIPEARDYVFNSVKRWMDPNNDGDPSDGIDGWRLDVAEKIDIQFWRDFRKVVKKINPEAYIVGEVWWEDWPNNKMFNARPWLEGDVFDAVMNYRSAKEVIHFFVDNENKITASEFDNRLLNLRNDYPSEVNYCLMNLLDSHDTDRLSSQIINFDDDYDHRDNPKDNPNYQVRKPTKEEIGIQKLIVTFQMTYIGAPMIYYGDEAGMWGADDPDCRKPMLWPELRYANEISHPMAQKRSVDKNRFNWELYNHYKKLIGIRRSHSALQVGKFETLLTDDTNDIYAFRRFDETETLIVALNNSDSLQTISLSHKYPDPIKSWTDELSQQSFKSNGEILSFEISPKMGVILR